VTKRRAILKTRIGIEKVMGDFDWLHCYSDYYILLLKCLKIRWRW